MEKRVLENTITEGIVRAYYDQLLESLSCDAVVVGAGPSGLVAARYLAEEGFKVVVFEKKVSLGGGIWGGGMLFNFAVVQEAALPILEDFQISYRKFKDNHYVVSAVELAASLILNAVKAGARIFNGVEVEDLVVKKENNHERVAGVVINWTTVLGAGLMVDPLMVSARAVLEATGHGCHLAAKLEERGTGLKVSGEGPLWSHMGEHAAVNSTREVFPSFFVSGMAAVALDGKPRMGPIFGGMLLSGKKAAELIAEKLREE